MAPYPRHSSIDSALRSKRPVNRTGPLLHRGFGADRKALPIFLVFHPLAARLPLRSSGQQRHSDSWFGHRIPGGTLPDNSGRSTRQPRPVPDILVRKTKWACGTLRSGDEKRGKPYANFDGWSVATVFPPWREDYGNNPLFHAPEKMDSDVESTRCNFSSRMRI